MPGHIYILVDGLSTKIGITEQSLEKRLASYKTHNPNFYIYKTYECSEIQAKKIEGVVKLYFKDLLAGTGKEWFSVAPEQIDRLVSFLLEPTTEEIIVPAMHGVRLPEEVYELRQKVVEALAEQAKAFKRPESKEEEKEAIRLSNNKREAKGNFADLFASCFKLGIPEHRLPQNIVKKERLGLDFYNCDKNSLAVEKGILKNNFQLPYDDHSEFFYHLVKLASGSYIAVCTAEVSMPWLKAIEGKLPEIQSYANDLGLYAFQYDEWSWYEPENTGLILYMHKTPIKKRITLWDNSFKKWVIERSKILEQEKFKDNEVLKKTIEDICYDTTFPLHVQSTKEFYDCYMEPFWDEKYDDEEYRHYMMDYYEFLFEKWKIGK